MMIKENPPQDLDAVSDTSIIGEVVDDLAVRNEKIANIEHAPTFVYFVLPMIFIVVTLLGGLRFGYSDNAFIFLGPALICLILATVLLVILFRSRLLDVDGWFDRQGPLLPNIAHAGILITLFTASVQVFNSLLPEQGLPFWVIGFCFVWTLWNNLFAEFDATKLLKSVGAMFALAFVAKYLILANLIAAPEGNWLQRIFENPGKEAFTWLLDLPRHSGVTGYVQFFTLVLYLLGLYLTPRSIRDRN